MKNRFFIYAIIIFILAAVSGAYYFFSEKTFAPATPTILITPTIFDEKNSSFVINGTKVTLDNGVSVVDSTPGSASKTITRFFGNDAIGNLTGNGQNDIAFLVTQDTGGSGLFYYVVVAYKTSAGYKTTNAFLIGDRIAPQTTEINSSARELYVNYATRKNGEPMTTQPSQGVTLYLKVTPDGVLEGLMK